MFQGQWWFLEGTRTAAGAPRAFAVRPDAHMSRSGWSAAARAAAAGPAGGSTAAHPLSLRAGGVGTTGRAGSLWGLVACTKAPAAAAVPISAGVAAAAAFCASEGWRLFWLQQSRIGDTFELSQQVVWTMDSLFVLQRANRHKPAELRS